MAFDFHTGHPTQPYIGYAEFNLAGHNFRAWQPGTSEAPRQWLIEVSEGEGVVLTRTVLMCNPNIFGPDIDDIEGLNLEIEKIIKELKLE